MNTRLAALLGALALVVTGTSPATAQTYDSGSTGVDGAFTLPNAGCPSQGTCTVTLPASGEFNYTTVNVPSGWTVKYTRNTANTPVTIRASGTVTIAGAIDVSGGNGGNGVQSATGLGPNAGVGGPGGFDGGSGANGIVSTTGGAGLGPGGGAGGSLNGDQGLGGGGGGFVLAGSSAPSSGGAGGLAYGTPTLLPMIGGSGGGGGGAKFSMTGGGGGGGGGALTIATSGTITLTGSILAKGGNASWPSGCCPGSGGGGSGSGGAVRLMATTIAGTSGTINVAAGTLVSGTGMGAAGALGRIRIESYTNTSQANLVGARASIVTQPSSVVLANAPTLRITAVGGVTTPMTPAASFKIPDVTLPAATTNPVHIDLAASQIPLGTTILVTVRGQSGPGTSATSTGLAGTLASSTAGVDVTLPTDQPCILTATATFEHVAWLGSGPIYAQGERIERVRVAATPGTASQVTYITVSGREIPMTAVR